MRIGVIGAGAIGGTIAALLERAGHEVAVTARGAHLEAIRTAGLRLSGAWGDHTARLEAAETLPAGLDLVFACTKAQDAGTALEAQRSRLGGIPVVVVQNGLSGLADAARALPDSPCVGALALYAASFLEPGAVSVTTAGGTWIGAGDGEPPAAAVEAARVLGAVMPARATRNFTGCQWTKLIVNQVNAMPAITGLSAQQTLSSPVLLPIITRSMKEAVRTGYAAGVRYGSLQGLSDGMLRAFTLAPAPLARVLPRLMGRRMGAKPNPGSTLQSIRRGQPTEIDYLNGAVVAAARAAGREAPVNAALTALVHEVERTSAFLAPDEVAARVP
ncbi:2-dehydropantoate 2-reductase [Microbacterium sp. STN6]|uniref:ketopantoate reductase family protein n=1 Tax=Microbacterium sp. STN6 TaxID=2995588 RepID=UPI002260C2DD|nr:2-dehydropantoate 2-reductase [Microbacterium sp. STN6]MCX7521219.1 2-dehydropantoate 2-reductase [Microbacterium sp. STN6]